MRLTLEDRQIGAQVAGHDTVTVLGSGAPLREFLYVDDLADALVFLIERYSGDRHVNIGSGEEISIHNLALLIANVVGWRGSISFDPSRPDGVPRKLLDVSKIRAMGWSAHTKFRAGLEATYGWYLKRSCSQ